MFLALEGEFRSFLECGVRADRSFKPGGPCMDVAILPYVNSQRRGGPGGGELPKRLESVARKRELRGPDLSFHCAKVGASRRLSVTGKGTIFFHHGDESAFKATTAAYVNREP